jgi:hypothetical protein
MNGARQQQQQQQQHTPSIGGGGASASSAAAALDPRNFTYASALSTPPQTLQEITVRQLHEDIGAYKYDLEFCNRQLNDPGVDLTPPEMRTFQIRVLDLGHQIRHCQHRIETIQFEMQQQQQAMQNGTASSPSGFSPITAGAMSAPSSATSANGLPRRAVPDTPTLSPPSSIKRRRTGNGVGAAAAAGSSGSMMDDIEDTSNNGTAVQRLGFWKCRLCTSEKYLTAGPGKQPSAPCKWPLRDVAKMIAHFLELHTEHTPAERCVELGAALDKNREFIHATCL